MVTIRQLRQFFFINVVLVAVYYNNKELKKLKDPEERKKAYYTDLKGEGWYRRVNPTLRYRVLDEEDKEALRKYAS